MTIKTLPLGQLETNCYILSAHGHAVVIDPADNGDEIADMLEKDGLQLDAICLTHVHYDHIGGVGRLAARTGVPVYVHPDDLAITGHMSCGLLTVKTTPYPETLTVGGVTVVVHHTPGHSPGSVCLMAGDALFVGDTLFAGSCGRTDFPGGSWEKMAASLRFLDSLPGDFTVYPGHDRVTRLSREREFNPYLREAKKQ